MKYIILSILVLFSLSAYSQIEDTPLFVGKYFGNQSGGGSGYWQVTGNFTDESGYYDAASIQVGDVLFFVDSGIGYHLPVTSIISASGSSFTIRVNNTGISGVAGVPNGPGGIYRSNSPKGIWPFTAGLTASDQQTLNSFLIKRLNNEPVKRDTFITVPHGTNYIPNLVIATPSRFYNNIYLSCKGISDTSTVAFLAAPTSDHYGVVYNIKNDSGLVETRVLSDAHLSNTKTSYLLRPGQMAQVRALKDQRQSGAYKWAVNLLWDSTATGSAGITALTGDVTASGTGSVAATIANNAVTSAKVASQTLDSTDLKNRGTTLLKLAQSGATNGQVPAYNSTSGNWEASTISGGAGNGIKHVFSNSQPSDTTVAWVDTRYDIQKSYCIRTYLNGAWTDTTDNARYYDFVGKTISYGKPIAILFSGQSNAGASTYFPNSNPTYYGDTTTRKNIAYWDQSAGVWKKYVFATKSDVFSATLGANQVIVLAQLIADKEHRAVRVVGTREPGQALDTWDTGEASWNSLVAKITACGIKRFDSFVWIHGEAGLGGGSPFSTYKEAFDDFIIRLSNYSSFKTTTKIIFPTHSLAIDIKNPSPVTAEGTAKGFDGDLNGYTGFAPIPTTKEAQFGAVDQYHFTTAEQEIHGQSLYNTWKSLPRLNQNTVNQFYVATFTSSNILRKQEFRPMASDSLANLFSSVNTNSGFFSDEFSLSNSNIYTSKKVVIPEGGNNRGVFEHWHSTTGAASSSNKIFSTSYLGSRFYSNGASVPLVAFTPSTTIAGLAVVSQSNNTGDAVLGFFNQGETGNPSTIGKTAIVARATGSFGQSDLHFVFSPSGGAVPVTGTNTLNIFKQNGLNGIGTSSPSARLHVAGSFTTQVTTITASTTLDVTHHTVSVSGASAAVDITLPNNNAGNAIVGREIVITCTNLTNAVRVLPITAASDLIYLPSGSTTTALSFTRIYQTFRFKSIATNVWVLQDNLDIQYKSTGSPEGSVTAPVGSIFQRTDGGINTTFYIKQSGTGNTGWAPAYTTGSPLTLPAGTATASTAPLKFTSGTNLTTPEAGALEYDGTEFYGTSSTASRTIFARVLKGSATLDFTSTAAGGVTDLTITVTGAADGDVVSLSVPNASQTATGSFSAWVSATNTVTVRYRIAALTGSEDPASGTFKVTVTK